MAISQGADRAYGDAHAAIGAGVVGEVTTEGGGDGGLKRPIGRLDGDNADHLVADSRAAIAHDTAIPLVVDGVAEVFVWLREFWTPVGIGVDVVQVGVVLQIAFTGLVAGGAVESVIDKVHLQNVLTSLCRPGRVREELDPFLEHGGAGFDQPAALAKDLDRANAARSPGPKQRLVAQVGHFDADGASGFEDCGAGRDGHVLTIDRAGHQLLLGCCHHVRMLPPFAGNA